MDTFTFTLTTAPGLHEEVGVTPSGFLDRLSDVVDGVATARLAEVRIVMLHSLAMTIDQDTGAVTLIFELDAENHEIAVLFARVGVHRLLELALEAEDNSLFARPGPPIIRRIAVELPDDLERAVA